MKSGICSYGARY